MLHLCDANFWIALTRASHNHHEKVVRWFEGFGEDDTFAFCRATQQSYLRLLTNAYVTHQPPLTNREALAGYLNLRRDSRMIWLDEPEGLDALWFRYAGIAQAAPTIWMDAYLAAFAVLAQARLVTLDKGFRVYRGLDWIDLNQVK